VKVVVIVYLYVCIYVFCLCAVAVTCDVYMEMRAYKTLLRSAKAWREEAEY
jgi:hypothetical protein